jgi:hypothetical protein
MGSSRGQFHNTWPLFSAKIEQTSPFYVATMCQCVDDPLVVFPKMFWPKLARPAFLFFLIYWLALQMGYIGRPVDWLQCALLKDKSL